MNLDLGRVNPLFEIMSLMVLECALDFTFR